VAPFVINARLWYNLVTCPFDFVPPPVERKEEGSLMTQLADFTLVKLPGSLVTEIRALRPDANLDSLVREAVHTYIVADQRRRLQKQLAHDYDALAAMYAELADELADEVWLPAENAALLQTEKGPAR